MISRRDSAGISPVVGVILMVVITVVLASVIMAVLTGMGSGLSESRTAGVSVDSAGNGAVTVQTTTFGNADRIIVSNGRRTWNLTSPSDIAEANYGADDDLTIMAEKDGERTVLHQKEYTESYKTRVTATSMSGDRVPRITYLVQDDYRYKTTRGISMLELNSSTGEFVSYGSYDTHAGDRYYYGDSRADGEPDITRHTDCSSDCNGKFISHLRQVDDGNYVVFLVNDQADNINQTAYNILHKQYGSDLDGNTTKLDYRGTWLMGSKKGTGAIYERFEPRGKDSGIYEISHQFYFPYNGSYALP